MCQICSRSDLAAEFRRTPPKCAGEDGVGDGDAVAGVFGYTRKHDLYSGQPDLRCALETYTRAMGKANRYDMDRVRKVKEVLTQIAYDEWKRSRAQLG